MFWIDNSIYNNNHSISIMNQPVVVSLLACSAAIAVSLANNTVPPTESVKTIPYPEVMNLSQVPTFNAQGMVPQANIAGKSPKKSLQSQSVSRVISAPITVDLVSNTVRQATIKKYGDACSSCRNLSPTVMVLGYSSDRAIGGLQRTMY
jgi:hypothetical protein